MQPEAGRHAKSVPRWVSTAISRFIAQTICAVLFNFRLPIASYLGHDLSAMLAGDLAY